MLLLKLTLDIKNRTLFLHLALQEKRISACQTFYLIIDKPNDANKYICFIS
jgi:hypothetical protein